MNKLLRLEESLNEMAAVAKHIAELKVQMKELRTREKQLRTLVENLPQRLYLRDRNSVYIFCNAPYAADLKMKAEDIAGKSVFEFFPEELAEEYAAEDKRIIETGRREEREEEYLAREDTLIVHALKIPVRDETGQITGVLGIFTDMTGLKRKENPGSEKAVVSLPGRDEGSLQESQEKFQTMVGNSDRKSKEHLISMFARLLQTDMNLDFLLKLESAELQNLTALTRDRVDQKTTCPQDVFLRIPRVDLKSLPPFSSENDPPKQEKRSTGTSRGAPLQRKPPPMSYQKLWNINPC